MSIGNDNMSDTPETDAAWAAESGNGLNEVREISRKLERERDEAKKENKGKLGCFACRKERDKTIKELNKAKNALEYIAHSGLSARHIEDYAKEFLSKTK
jgi:hypothetical protein